jgi:hypothetical protein
MHFALVFNTVSDQTDSVLHVAKERRTSVGIGCVVSTGIMLLATEIVEKYKAAIARIGFEPEGFAQAYSVRLMVTPIS